MAEQKKHNSTIHCGIKQKVYFFIASLDQRLQAYKLLAGQFGWSGCLSTLSPEDTDSCKDTR